VNEVLIFLVSWVVPLLLWGAVVMAAALWLEPRLKVGPFVFSFVYGVPFSLGLIPITAFTYWAMEAWT
jgi:hypothetical protein